MNLYQSEVPVSFPIRLSPTLHKEFTRISESTNITKSKLVRLAIARMIKDVDNSGAIESINYFSEI